MFNTDQALLMSRVRRVRCEMIIEGIREIRGILNFASDAAVQEGCSRAVKSASEVKGDCRYSC